MSALGPAVRDLAALGEAIVAATPGMTRDPRVAYGELTITVERAAVAAVVRVLHDDPRFGFVTVIDICGVDFPERPERFEVVYHLLSPSLNRRLRLKLVAGEGDLVPSLTDLHPSANWFEREAFDLYGILFSGHPDLRRILTDYGFEGYPLRKDFPLTGYLEVRYDDERKQVVYEPVTLPQEFRNFDFLSPWEGTDYTLPGDEKGK